MAQTIKLKRSATQGAIPTVAQLDLGEVAINTFDGKMYIKKDVNGTLSVVEIGANASFTPAGDDGSIQFNNNGVIGGAGFLYVDDTNNRLGIGTTTPSYNLEVSGIIGTTSIQLDTATTTDPIAQGQIAWNSDTGTAELGLNSDVALEMGEQTYINVKAAEAISTGDVLYASGAVGNSGKIEVSKFIANGTIEEQRVVGIAAQSIALGDFGYVITFGTLRGLITDGSNLTTPEVWVTGDILYASPNVAGELTKVPPIAPNQKISIAFITSAHATVGSIVVRASDLGYHLGELHDIEFTSLTNNDIIAWNTANSRWQNVTIPSIVDSRYVNVTGDTMTGNLNFADSVKAMFGAGNDLQIYHDGTNSYINESGTGSLYITTTNGGGVFFTSAGENLAQFFSNGEAKLFYDNAAKLSTTATGIDVAGTATMDGLTVSASAPNVLIQGVSATDASLTLSSSGITNWALRNESTDSALYFTQDGVTRVKLSSGGGIDVIGTVVADAIHVPGGGNIATNEAFGTGALVANTTGINNTASGFNALYSNTSGNYNSASGSDALYSNTTGSYNSASGRFALYSNTTGYYNSASGANALYSNTFGNFNSASGFDALYENTTGAFNTASGAYALRSNSTGSNNTASGANALRLNTTGSSNTASGRDALYYNTTGIDNTSSGYGALRSNTTGSSNTASGANALRSNIDGSYNSASGREALRFNTTGSSNTASGVNALYYNTTGVSNSASGRDALFSNSTGSYNTASGRNALSFNTTGSYNTALGMNAGNQITTGSKNTILGGYNGNQGGLDIRTANNHIVLSDGDGNPRLHIDSTGAATFNVTRTSGANKDSIFLSDNVTGIQTSGFGTRIVGASNGNNALSVIAFEADGGTNNDTAIAFYTQATAGALTRQLHIGRTGTATFSGEITANGGIALGDNDKATFNSNLNIFSSGTSSYIEEVGAGDLYLKASNLYITDRENNQFISMIDNGTGGTVSLKHLGSDKLTTTATGIDITGTATMDGLTVTGTLGNFAVDTQGAIATFSRPSTSYIRASDVSGALRFDTGGSIARLNIANNGDISFYEDTGTTPKFFWDASAESLGIGTSSPSATYSIDAAKGIRSSGVAPNFTLQETDASNQTWLMASYGGNFAIRDTTVAGTAYPFQIEAATPSNTLYLDSTGNVGIGTSSPQKIHGGASLDGETSTGFEFIAGNNTVSTVGGEFLGGYAFRNNDSSGTPDHYSGIRAVASDSFGSANLEFYAGRDSYEAGTSPHMTIRGNTNAALNGNVGIGTSLPSAKLELDNGAEGDYFIAGGDNISNGRSLRFTSSTSSSGSVGALHTIKANSTAGEIAFANGDGTIMYLKDGGNVGIGTTSPATALDVAGTITADGLVVSAPSGDTPASIVTTTAGSFLQFTDVNTTAGRSPLVGAITDGLAFYTNAGSYSEKMTLTASGNVGIGTTSPSELLEIAGVANSTSTGIAIKNGSATRLRIFHDDNGGASYISSYDVGAAQALVIRSGNNLLLSGGGGTEHARIDSSGNVGIGTSSPNQKLTVSGGRSYFGANNEPYAIGVGYNETRTASNQTYFIGATNSTAPALRFSNSDGSEKLRVTHAGNVGIGTTAPDAPLSIYDADLTTTGGSGVGGIRVHRPGSFGQFGYMEYGYASSTTYIGSSYTGSTAANYGEIHFRQHSNGGTPLTSMVLNSVGNVGIGTTAPTSKVHIEGSSDGTGPGVDAMLHVKQTGTWNGNEPWALYVDGYSYLNGFRINANDGIRALYKTQSGGTLGFATAGADPITFTQSDSVEKMRIHSDGNVGIGTSAPLTKLQVEEYGIDTTTTASAAVTPIAIDSFPVANFRSARYTVQVSNTTDSTYFLTEILMVHNGTTTQIVEYGTIYTGAAAEAAFTSDISTGNVRLIATPASADSMTFKVVRHSIAV